MFGGDVPKCECDERIICDFRHLKTRGGLRIFRRNGFNDLVLFFSIILFIRKPQVISQGK